METLDSNEEAVAKTGMLLDRGFLLSFPGGAVEDDRTAGIDFRLPGLWGTAAVEDPTGGDITC